jgi:hypothetical protein
VCQAGPRELAALGIRWRRTTIIHRTVRWCTGLSGEPTVASANGRPRNPRATRGPQRRSVGHTRLSGVHRTVFGAPTDPEDQRSDALERKEIAHRTSTVTVRWCTCWCFGSDRTPGVAPQGAFRSRTVLSTVVQWFVLVA